ncbi:MAG: bifunctional metallophosphatase/5'-nucleotidase [Desulfobacteraceae bacterium]|nr:bifunctional metallophosphatase/5'-nucleotidase [Desulfobacteraceae bacterium]MCB9494057.1 bifunctional metallophosphatase/5'-nucleotidase [Desulfobacteraceae bacterium]
MNKIFFKLTVFVLFSTFISCSHSNDFKNRENSYFRLQVLHFSDIDGNEDRALKNLDNFSAVMNGIKNSSDYPTIIVSSGDNIIQGPRFYAAEHENVSAITKSNNPGSADIAILNRFGVMASAVGNHELDAGPGAFADALSADNGPSRAEFPYLSCNMDFSRDSSFGPGTNVEIGNDCEIIENLAGKISKSAVLEINGEKIGIVGASSPEFPNITSTGDIEVTPSMGYDIKELAHIIQACVDDLSKMQINKIILLSHMQQISIEKQLASLLENVDIIVAGGSNTLLADENDILLPGDEPKDTYPLVFTSPSDEPVLVVNVDADYKYLGRLVADFDSNGVIVTSKLDSSLNGPIASSIENADYFSSDPDPQIIKIRDAVQDVIKSQYSNVLGYTDVFLEGRGIKVRTQETNLGNLTSKANLWYANLLSDSKVDISVKNGGDIRTEIGSVVVPPGSTDSNDVSLIPPPANEETGTQQGAVTEGHLRAVLKFDNGLVCFSVTAEELKDIMEHSVAASGEGEYPGQFPQIAGMRIVYDLNRSPRTSKGTGNRIVELAVLNDDFTSDKDIVVSNGEITGDPNRKFRLVTIYFLAQGGNSYPFDSLSSPERTNLFEGEGLNNGVDFLKDPKKSSFAKTGGEQDAFAEYLYQFHGDPEHAYNIEETDIDEDRIIRLY